MKIETNELKDDLDDAIDYINNFEVKRVKMDSWKTPDEGNSSFKRLVRNIIIKIKDD